MSIFQVLARNTAWTSLIGRMHDAAGGRSGLAPGLAKEAPLRSGLAVIAPHRGLAKKDDAFPWAKQGIYQRMEERVLAQEASYHLAIRSADGRSASLSFDYQSLRFEQQYTRVSIASSSAALAGSREQGLREGFAQELLQHQSLQQSSAWSLRIEGDIELLQGHFAAAPTAQRIFDFVSGLGGGISQDDPRFASFHADISRGIAQGFAQAEAALGSLHQVSWDTRSLLDYMLDDYRRSVTGIRAEDYLPLLEPRREQ